MKLTRKITKPFRWLIHRFIVRYLGRCACAFHHGPYGTEGVYVVLMSDQQFHDFKTKVR